VRKKRVEGTRGEAKVRINLVGECACVSASCILISWRASCKGRVLPAGEVRALLDFQEGGTVNMLVSVQVES